MGIKSVRRTNQITSLFIKSDGFYAMLVVFMSGRVAINVGV
jgi:hypothetical protein